MFVLTWFELTISYIVYIIYILSNTIRGYLDLIMKFHLNVEICSSVKSIKYVLKYVHKASDQANFQGTDPSSRDDVSDYINARYSGSTEAACRINEWRCTVVTRFLQLCGLFCLLTIFRCFFFQLFMDLC